MAKKQNKVMASIGQKNMASLKEEARKNMMSSRQKFRGLDFTVRGNREILDKDFILEVDRDGQPTLKSFADLESCAKVILSANFKPKNAKLSSDLGWGIARWSISRSAKEAGLDPSFTFEVGLSVARRPDKDRAAKVMRLIECTEIVDGKTLRPNDAGEHLDVPAMAMVCGAKVITVVREGEELCLATFYEVLLKLQTHKWATPTKNEVESRKAEAAAEAKAAEAKAEADSVLNMFNDIFKQEEAAEIAAKVAEEAEKERLRQEELKVQWQKISHNPLMDAWQSVAWEANNAWKDAQVNVNMVLGLIRPGSPAEESVRSLYKMCGTDTCNYIAEWVRDTYHSRKELTLRECVLMFKQSQTGVLVDEWFDSTGTPLPPLGTLLEYNTHEEWIKAMEAFPALPAEVVEDMKEMFNKTTEENTQ